MMRKNWKMMILILIIILSEPAAVYAKENAENDYAKDYEKRVFNSENGLEGTAVKCILAAEDGRLWIGGYAGLFVYDGTEFTSCDMGQGVIAVNSILQDQQGNLWIGTNGEGVYTYDGRCFAVCDTVDASVSDCVVNDLLESDNGDIYAGTKAGLFVRKSLQSGKLERVECIGEQAIQDLQSLQDGRVVVITKTGDVFVIKDGEAEKIEISQQYQGKIRCCGSVGDDFVYLGTYGSEILKLSVKEKKIKIIDGDGLSSFNTISEINEDEYWVCSDTGIGVLKHDEITRMDFPIDNSVEDVCVDYQGNFWFASSRQGVLQLSKSSFSDLGEYLNLNQTVNSIQYYQNQLYIGCDEGLYCFTGNVRTENRLVQLCKTQRIRQLYVDDEDNLWVADYQNGLYRQDVSGSVKRYHTGNCGLTTNQIRCVIQSRQADVLIGTEDGIFVITKEDKIEKYVEDEELAHQRIMDIKEDESGRIYAATDGSGVFVLKDRRIERRYTKDEGLLSNVVMKIVPSETYPGVWLVTGSGVCYLEEGTIKRITGIPIANSLDLLIDEDGAVFVLAGNGLFKMTEHELLKRQNQRYQCYTKRDGLPIDFTANSWNIIYDGRLYMCGTEGAASMEVADKDISREIKMYVNSIRADGKGIYMENDTVILPATVHRLSIDVRILQYSSGNVWVSYYLEGFDREPVMTSNRQLSSVSYTNLKGGNYTFHIKIYDRLKENCLEEQHISITKNFNFWENPRVRTLLVTLGIVVIGIGLLIIIEISKKQIKRKYKQKYLEKQSEEMERMAYRDLVTGTYNRNLFEMEKSEIDKKNLCALVMVSLNHTSYLRKKYGTLKMESVLIELVKVLEKSVPEGTKLYRISEHAFCFWILKKVDLDLLVYEIKKEFQGEDKSEKSVAIGAVYYDGLKREDIDELLERCERMRMIDEKQAEARFMEGKVKWL